MGRHVRLADARVLPPSRFTKLDSDLGMEEYDVGRPQNYSFRYDNQQWVNKRNEPSGQPVQDCVPGFIQLIHGFACSRVIYIMGVGVKGPSRANFQYIHSFIRDVFFWRWIIYTIIIILSFAILIYEDENGHPGGCELCIPCLFVQGESM